MHAPSATSRDIAALVAGRVSRDDLPALRCTCHALNTAAAAYIRHITIKKWPKSIPKAPWQGLHNVLRIDATIKRHMDWAHVSWMTMHLKQLQSVGLKLHGRDMPALAVEGFTGLTRLDFSDPLGSDDDSQSRVSDRSMFEPASLLPQNTRLPSLKALCLDYPHDFGVKLDAIAAFAPNLEYLFVWKLQVDLPCTAVLANCTHFGGETISVYERRAAQPAQQQKPTLHPIHDKDSTYSGDSSSNDADLPAMAGLILEPAAPSRLPDFSKARSKVQTAVAGALPSLRVLSRAPDLWANIDDVYYNFGVQGLLQCCTNLTAVRAANGDWCECLSPLSFADLKQLQRLHIIVSEVWYPPWDREHDDFGHIAEIATLQYVGLDARMNEQVQSWLSGISQLAHLKAVAAPIWIICDKCISRGGDLGMSSCSVLRKQLVQLAARPGLEALVFLPSHSCAAHGRESIKQGYKSFCADVAAAAAAPAGAVPDYASRSAGSSHSAVQRQGHCHCKIVRLENEMDDNLIGRRPGGWPSSAAGREAHLTGQHTVWGVYGPLHEWK